MPVLHNNNNIITMILVLFLLTEFTLFIAWSEQGNLSF